MTRNVTDALRAGNRPAALAWTLCANELGYDLKSAMAVRTGVAQQLSVSQRSPFARALDFREKPSLRRP